jgi:dihydrofolate reductase
MRKIHMFMTVSLDGYFEGKDHDLSWHNVDAEFNEFAIEQLRETGLMLWGRRTYELMEGFWPKAEAEQKMTRDDLEVARLMNNTPKMVISRTLKSVKEGPNWKNVTLRNELDVGEIRKLKQQPGKDIWAGGSELVVSLLKEGLMDGLRLMVNPVVIGSGTPLFKGLDSRMKFKLTNTRVFKSGNMLLLYDVQS